MTDEQQDIVAKAEALLANVTPGAWVADRDHESTDYATLMAHDGATATSKTVAYGNANGEVHFPNPTDAEFIATAPELVRELLAEVKRLRVLMARVPYVLENDAWYIATKEGPHALISEHRAIAKAIREAVPYPLDRAGGDSE